MPEEVEAGVDTRAAGRRPRADSPRPVGSSSASAHRVLFLSTQTKPPLGADVWVLVQAIRSLDPTGHDVHVWLSVVDGDGPTDAYRMIRDVPGLQVHRLDVGELAAGAGVLRRVQAVGRAVRDVIRLARTVRRESIAIVHAADRPRDAALCVVLSKLGGATSVVHCNLGYGDWMARPLRWALRRADALVAVSSFVAGTLVESGHRPDRVHVVLNAIPVDEWVAGRGRDDVRRELGVTGNDPVVLSVCRLMPQKGPEMLIRACAALRPQLPGLRLVIAGVEVDPSFRAVLTSTIDELDVADMVTLAGWRDDVPRLMAAADVYAMPSTMEPFGLVFCEAMAMGLSVIALDDGGTPEVVVDGETGLLSAHGDLDGLIANLSKVLLDGEYRAALGAAGQERVNHHFTTARFGRDLAALYDRLVAGR
jgi:glycosyltransferase involved in cell wall biosynthesis